MAYPVQRSGAGCKGQTDERRGAESDTWIAKGSKFLGSPDRVWVESSFKVALRKDALPDVNLWWDDGLDEPVILCSNALRDAVVAAGLNSIPLIKAKEV